MNRRVSKLQRRELLTALGGLALSLPFAGQARAEGLGSRVLSVLGQASDSSLERLSQPGAFYDDPAIRIAFPLIGGDLGKGLGKGLGKALDLGQQYGVTENIVRQINDAAGVAAGKAKPIFRNAIGRLTVADVPDLATQDDGIAQYLQRSATPALKERFRPLVDMALMRTGAAAQVDRLLGKSKLLRAAGLTQDRLADSVTDQALSGIFTYIAAEESRLRSDPLGTAGGILGRALGN